MVDHDDQNAGIAVQTRSGRETVPPELEIVSRLASAMPSQPGANRGRGQRTATDYDPASASTSSAAECIGPARPGSTRWPRI